MRRNLLSMTLSLFILLTSCETVNKKISETVKKENQKLSMFIGKNQRHVLIELGQPNEELRDEKGFRNLIYQSKRYGLKCVRKFTVDEGDMITGFESKGCF